MASSQSDSDAASRLLGAITVLYRARPLTETVAEIVAAADPTRLRAGPRSALPVVQFVAQACRLAEAGPLTRIAAAFATLAPHLPWSQNANYVAAPPDPAFLDSYGYVELVGPGRAIESGVCRVGFLLLGPDTHYPAHVHPAEEVYHVVGGRASWWREGAEWQVQAPGTAIHHPPYLPHATRCSDEPLLALYCWTGDIDTAARLI